LGRLVPQRRKMKRLLMFAAGIVTAVLLALIGKYTAEYYYLFRKIEVRK